ncbi:restriction endonuclease [Streptomyces sp. NPDC048518]|uniref:restriction endonuclease n=1 Tax=Streptomyces sp. NPDC048518 TaxID=3155029 RepID=UPI0033DBA5D6
MTVPSRPVRRRDRERRFDLRTTALFFVLVAVALCGTVFLVRAAAQMAQTRPLWVGSLVVVGLAAACLGRARWRRFSAARYARRAAEVLEEAAERASASLDATAPAGPAPAVAGAADLRGAGGRRPRDETYVDQTYVDQTYADQTDADQTDMAETYVAETTYTVSEPASETLVLDDDVEAATTVVLDTPVDYAALDPDGFEQAIADLCARDACQDAQVVGGACDLGADVLAVAPDGRRVVIQCKRYGADHKVGSQDLQRFGGTCFTVHEADVAALVTTSDFTAPALEYAEQCGIVCVNGADLQAWCDGTGPNPWELVPVEA